MGLGERAAGWVRVGTVPRQRAESSAARRGPSLGTAPPGQSHPVGSSIKPEGCRGCPRVTTTSTALTDTQEPASQVGPERNHEGGSGVQESEGPLTQCGCGCGFCSTSCGAKCLGHLGFNSHQVCPPCKAGWAGTFYQSQPGTQRQLSQ